MHAVDVELMTLGCTWFFVGHIGVYLPRHPELVRPEESGVSGPIMGD